MERDFTKIEENGVVVGLIGARFVRADRMECEDIKISKTQNTFENGYGQNTNNSNTIYNKLWQYLFPDPAISPHIEKLQDYRRIWNKFYEEPDHLYENISRDDKRFGTSFKCQAIFDNVLMKKRYAISFDTLLLEANERAQREEQYAYIHVVGIGLGVWMAAEQQEKIFMECFGQRLKYLLPKLNSVGVVHLSWFLLEEWDILKNEGFLESETHPRSGIKILISRRNPNEKLVRFYAGNTIGSYVVRT